MKDEIEVFCELYNFLSILQLRPFDEWMCFFYQICKIDTSLRWWFFKVHLTIV
jgi:hypothetical protein